MDGRRHRRRPIEREGGRQGFPRYRRLRSFRHEINLSSNSHENEPEPANATARAESPIHDPKTE